MGHFTGQLVWSLQQISVTERQWYWIKGKLRAQNQGALEIGKTSCKGHFLGQLEQYLHGVGIR
jgi:hypothetical protein